MDDDALCVLADDAVALSQDGQIVAVDLLKVGRIEQLHRCKKSLTPEERLAWEWLASNGGAGYLSRGARLYDRHLHEHVRRHGGTITTERHTFENGRRGVNRTVQHFPGRSLPAPRPRGAGRPRGRRARRTTSTRAGPSDDSGEPEPGPRSGPPLLFVVHPKYGRVSFALARLLGRLDA